MREILFRGKRIDNGEWVEGGIDTDWGVSVAERERYWIDRPYLGKISVIPETVGQYTGLTDKNGTMIFEGDIVVDKYSCEKFGFVGVVKYNSELTQFQIVSKFYPDYIVNMGRRRDSIRILGNQYDNPELLERQG